MHQFHVYTINHPRGVRWGFSRSFAEVVASWRADATFRAWFGDQLAAVPYAAFRWETPAATLATLTQPFECVILDAPELDREPDAEAFAEHFRAAEAIVRFANLRGDATLIVPTPQGDVSTYGHLASFVRGAPRSQREELWRVVGESMAMRVSTQPVWLSTAGAGVAWLHVRLDETPKYYHYSAFRHTNRII